MLTKTSIRLPSRSEWQTIIYELQHTQHSHMLDTVFRKSYGGKNKYIILQYLSVLNSVKKFSNSKENRTKI